MGRVGAKGQAWKAKGLGLAARLAAQRVGARVALGLACVWALAAPGAPPAQAWEIVGPRVIGRETIVPLSSGWFLGTALTSPFALCLAGGYTQPPMPWGWKVGGHWGVLGPNGEQLAFQAQDWRAFGALSYALAPLASTPGLGPYIELGAGRSRSRTPLRELGWILVPHVGFGTILGDAGKGALWDLSFAANADGYLTLQIGLLLSERHDPNAPLPPWPSPEPRR